jgi:hypothetical protein
MFSFSAVFSEVIGMSDTNNRAWICAIERLTPPVSPISAANYEALESRGHFAPTCASQKGARPA